MSSKSRPSKGKVRRKAPGAPGRTGSSDRPSGSGARYTAPTRPQPRFRPTWHKVIGTGVVPAGFGLFVVCQFNVGNIHAYGGHFWFLVGFAIALSSLWWWGAFDPPGSGFVG